jgi:hypothetical protein
MAARALEWPMRASGLKRAMAKCGYRDVKEFQKVALVLDRTS